MKKILIIGSDMEIGGAERALLGLLAAIDTSKYSVDLFLLRHQGAFMHLIPDTIHLLPETPQYADLAVPIGRVVKKGHLGMVLGRTIGKGLAKKYIKKHNISGMNSVEILYSFLYTKPFLPMISSKEYDLAVGFTVPYYLADEKVNAKTKVVWLHTDYSCIDGNLEEEQKVWSAYKYIISISKAVTESFLKKFPELSEKIVEIENVVSPDVIKQQVNLLKVQDEMPEEAGVFRLLSIGRYCEAKNFDNVPDICSRILRLGCNIKWYIIGFGGDEELIRKKISEAHMEDYVILLGKKENPYPYIKACDLYVQPSRFEGKAVTVREAQILNKPVVITDYPTAHSQLKDGWDGMIIPLDNQKCAESLSGIIKNKKLLERLSRNTAQENYSNEYEVEKLYRLME